MGFFFSPRKVTRVAAPRGAVAPSCKTLMEQRGWTRTRLGGTGPFATRYGTWPGSFENAGGRIRIYIRNPPPALRKHPKWACFHQHGDSGWWRIHLATNPSDGDPNAVVHYIERIITESFHL